MNANATVVSLIIAVAGRPDPPQYNDLRCLSPIIQGAVTRAFVTHFKIKYEKDNSLHRLSCLPGRFDNKQEPA